MSRVIVDPWGRPYYAVDSRPNQLHFVYHPFDPPHYWLSAEVRIAGQGYGPAQDFLFDTGADMCVVDQAFAKSHHFDLTVGEKLNMSGLGTQAGGEPGRVIYHDVRFVDLGDRVARLPFWVPDGNLTIQTPVIGTGKFFEYFSVVLREDESFFVPC